MLKVSPNNFFVFQYISFLLLNLISFKIFLCYFLQFNPIFMDLIQGIIYFYLFKVFVAKHIYIVITNFLLLHLKNFIMFKVFLKFNYY